MQPEGVAPSAPQQATEIPEAQTTSDSSDGFRDATVNAGAAPAAAATATAAPGVELVSRSQGNRIEDLLQQNLEQQKLTNSALAGLSTTLGRLTVDNLGLGPQFDDAERAEFDALQGRNVFQPGSSANGDARVVPL